MLIDKKHFTQLVRVLNSIFTLISTEAKILAQSETPALWEKTLSEAVKLNILEEDREKIVKKHFTQIKQLIEQKNPIFYTDESRLKLTN